MSVEVCLISFCKVSSLHLKNLWGLECRCYDQGPLIGPKCYEDTGKHKNKQTKHFLSYEKGRYKIVTMRE